MVQRKGPDIGVGKLPSTKVQASSKEKPTPGSQDETKGKEAGGMSQLKRKLKKARSIKRVAELGELDAHLVGHPQKDKLSENPAPAGADAGHSMTPAAKPHKPSTPTKSSSKQPLPKASPAKGTDMAAAPNYMKGTNSSDARKDQQRQVQFRPLTPPTPAAAAAKKNKIPKNSTTSSKPPKPPSISTVTPAPAPPLPRTMKKSASIKKSAKMLTKKLSLKPIRSLMRKCSEALMFQNSGAGAGKPTPSEAPPMFPDVTASKPTCSSTLKDSKFPNELELDPGGTEADGTSAVKVCPFTHCSLNGHYHGEAAPPLPLKRFVSMRRRSLKKQKSMKLRQQLSVKRRGSLVKGLKRAKSRKGGYSVDVSPAIAEANDGDDDFFLEIYDDPRAGVVDPNLYEGGVVDAGKAKTHSTEITEEPGEEQGGATMNNHQFDDSNNNSTFGESDDNDEADLQSTTGGEGPGQELKKRRNMKLRQLSVRRRSMQKNLKRAKSRKRASFEFFPALDLPDNHGDDCFAETYDVPRGGIVDPRVYDSSSKYEESGDSNEAKLHRTGSAVEANSRGTKGAEVPSESQKGDKQRLTTRPPVDSYTELSFDDNFDMVSEVSFSETEVIEQFLDFIECLDQEDPPAEEAFLPLAHKDRKRWGSGWDPDRNMVFATGNFQDKQESNLVSDAIARELVEEMFEYVVSGMVEEKSYGSDIHDNKATTLSDDLDGSKREDLSIELSTAALMRDPSCEIGMGETLLKGRNEASFNMDEIYCRFNFTDSEPNITSEIKDTSDQKPEKFQQGIAEEEHNEKGEEGHQLLQQKSESIEAEVIAAAAEGSVERGLSEIGNNGCSANNTPSEMQADEKDITRTCNEAHNIADFAKDVVDGAVSCADISTSEEATKDSCSLDNHAGSSSIDQSSQGSLEGKKDDKDREEYEESISTVTKQHKPTAEDNYDKLARKAIEDSVEEVYIYGVLKGSDGPAIISAITDAIADPDQGVQGPQSKPKSRFNMTRKKAVQYLDKIRSFNPRPPNFLPVEPDPDAEKVDLRHQEMNEKKDAEEWMIDHALQKLLNRLAPAQKKVTLIVKAFEAVASVPTSDHTLQHEDVSFARTRPMQACS